MTLDSALLWKVGIFLVFALVGLLVVLLDKRLLERQGVKIPTALLLLARVMLGTGIALVAVMTVEPIANNGDIWYKILAVLLALLGAGAAGVFYYQEDRGTRDDWRYNFAVKVSVPLGIGLLFILPLIWWLCHAAVHTIFYVWAMQIGFVLALGVMFVDLVMDQWFTAKQLSITALVLAVGFLLMVTVGMGIPAVMDMIHL